MADAETKVPVTSGGEAPAPSSTSDLWRPFDGLRRQIDRLFEDFDKGPWHFPFARSLFDVEPIAKRAVSLWNGLPAVDIAERERQYEITAELPGMDEKDIEVHLNNRTLTIKGEKREEKEEKKKDYYLSERHYGAFQRSFLVPEGVDTNKIEAVFKKGVLTLTLPKSAEAQQQGKKIDVKAA